MAAGDLVTKPGQMEIWRGNDDRLLIGKGTAYHWLELGGTDMPGMRTNDYERPLGHGTVAGTDRLGARQLVGAMAIVADTSAQVHDLLSALGKAFRPTRPGEDDPILTWWHWGASAKQRLVGRPRRLEWRHVRRLILQHVAQAGWLFEAPDPRFYSAAEQSLTKTIEPGDSSISVTANNAGNMEMEPILEITGPWVNPRIANQDDENRQVRIDISLSGGQKLVVDIAKRTVTLAGVDRYSTVRADNQWWELVPGDNLITASRTGSTGAGVLKLRWRNAWATAGD